MAVFDELARNDVGPGMHGVIYDDESVGPLESAAPGKVAVGRIEEFLEGWITLTPAHYQTPDPAAAPHLSAIFAKLAKCHAIQVECAPRQARILNDIQMQSNLVVSGAADVGAERWEALLAGAHASIDIASLTKSLLEELAAISLNADELCFCHNDLQYGNVMLHEATKRYTFIDFEYAGYNPLYYDVANIWCEVPANYTEGVSSVGFLQDFTKHFPSSDLQHFTAACYLSVKQGGQVDADSAAVRDFVRKCQPWIRASHLFWGLWGILQARSRRGETLKEGDFDYAAYAANRLNAYLSF